MAGRLRVDLDLERAGTGLAQRGGHPRLVVPHQFLVGRSRERRVVLGAAEAAVVVQVQYLYLPPAPPRGPSR